MEWKPYVGAGGPGILVYVDGAMLKLNLGCSDDHKPGYVNVDQAEPADLIADLRLKWPWEDSSVDEIIAVHVFEHLDNEQYPANKGKIWCMNEAWRVLKPGGALLLTVPTVDGIGAFADPTHVSFWTKDDRYYFCEEWNHTAGERGRLGPAYGIVALFREIYWQHSQYHPGRFHVQARLEAVK